MPRSSARAIQYAEHGFPIRLSTARGVEQQLDFFKAWPDNQKYWLKSDGTTYKPGETIKLPTLARTLKRMVDAERGARRKGRNAGIAAARDLFYKGAIAKEMVAFLQKHGAPFDLSDFADYTARIEEPAQTTYRGYTVYKHSFTSQGPVLLQALNILENFDLRGMRHDSADYIHTVIEALKLAYADRDTYYADTAFVQVPGEGLLSKAYAKERAALIDPKTASKAFIAGDPLKFDSKVKEWTFSRYNIPDGTRLPTTSGSASTALGASDSAGVVKDTTHMAVIDKDGNIFDVTPSGGWIPGAVILGDTGIGMSVRGEQFWLDKMMANQIRPRARPRYTLTPSLVFKGDTPLMALGTPGGDNQDQTIIQAFLNIVEFWDAWYPNLHSALEWPRFQTLHFHGSFWPHSAGFNKLNLEADIPDAVFNELKARGHDVSRIRSYRNVRLRDDGVDRSGNAEPVRRRRSAARLLCVGALGRDRGSGIGGQGRRTQERRNLGTQKPRRERSRQLRPDASVILQERDIRAHAGAAGECAHAVQEKRRDRAPNESLAFCFG